MLSNTIASKHNIVIVNQVRAKKGKQDKDKIVKTQQVVNAINAKLLREKDKIAKERLKF